MIRLASTTDKGTRKVRPIPEVKSGLFISAIATELGDIESDPHAATRPRTPTVVAKPIKSRFVRVLLAGAGFLADAYDLFVINLVLRLLRDEYPGYAQSSQIHAYEGSVAASALVGSIIGQLVAGTLADIIGRKKLFVATAILISIGSIGSAFCFDKFGRRDSANVLFGDDTQAQWLTVYGQLACWRFVLGLGVGGEYPLAATVTSESSSAKRRGSLMAGVFSMQGVGALLSVVVVISCLRSGASNNFTWRFALAFGAVPVLFAFPWRLKMHETDTFQRVKKEREKSGRIAAGLPVVDSIATIDALYSQEAGLQSSMPNNNNGANLSETAPLMMNNHSQNDSNSSRSRSNDGYGTGSGASNSSGGDSSSLGGRSVPSRANVSKAALPQQASHIHDSDGSRVSEMKRAWRYYKWHMLGTALCWFLLDVDFYANGLFNHEITSTVLFHGESTALIDAYNTGLLGLIAIPGYYLSVLYIDTVGRKNLQMMGFSMMAILFTTCSLSFNFLLASEGGAMRKYLFLLIYALTFLFSNFGPNTTSFVIPGEIFPAEVRATCHGVSAASGKLGAATGAYVFPLLLGPGGASDPTMEGIRYTMLLCAIVAICGAIVTYLFIPSYNADMLVSESKYLALEQECLRPSRVDMLLLEGWSEHSHNHINSGSNDPNSYRDASDNNGDSGTKFPASLSLAPTTPTEAAQNQQTQLNEVLTPVGQMQQVVMGAADFSVDEMDFVDAKTGQSMDTAGTGDTTPTAIGSGNSARSKNTVALAGISTATEHS